MNIETCSAGQRCKSQDIVDMLKVKLESIKDFILISYDIDALKERYEKAHNESFQYTRKSRYTYIINKI